MRLLYVVFVLAAVIVLQLGAQAPFKASQGLKCARDSAIKAGLSKAKLTAIATIGDTTFFGSYLPSVVKAVVKFDPANGTSAFWGYRFHDVVGTKDSSIGFVVLKVIVPFFAQRAGIPEIPDLPISLDSALPNIFMDSDVMSSKVIANSEYKSYMSVHKNAKFQAIALGMSNGEIVPPGPTWIVFVAEHLNDNPLNCIVTAKDNNGTAECVEVASTAVPDMTSADQLHLYPNPSAESLILHVPLEVYSPDISLEVYTLMGAKVLTYPLQQVAGGMNISLPINDLINGNYFLRYTGGSVTRMLRFTVEK